MIRLRIGRETEEPVHSIRCGAACTSNQTSGFSVPLGLRGEKHQSVLVNSGTCSVLALASIISSTRWLGADSCSRVVGSGPFTVK